jgi:hypothetical protein
MKILALVLLPALLPGGAPPDQVTYVDSGKVLKGRVVYDTPHKLVLRQGARDTVIDPADLKEVRSLERSLAKVLDRELQGADARTLLEIAQECDAAGLEAEARQFWLRTLLADPASELAGKALKVQRIKDELKVPFGKLRRTLAQLRERQGSWKEALEIECTHFQLKTDLDLPLALDLAMGLERNYRRFYETLGAPLELYLFDEAPEICVYARKEDFPVGPLAGDPIWFAPGINTLNVLADPDPSVSGVIRELTRLMLFNALRRGSGSTAQVPQWTVSGICELFAKAAPAVRFGKWSEIGVPDKRDFERALADQIPFDKLFNSSGNDFNADAKRGDMNASAYTLVHYLVFGRQKSLRAPYGEFLRNGAKGKISIGAFSDALEMSKKDIESAWRAYVEEQAR